MKKLAATAIPPGLDFAAVDGLSSEVRQKLARARPATLREAAAHPRRDAGGPQRHQHPPGR